MSRKQSIIKSTGWDAAIQAAEREIEKLETSIRVFKRNKEAGEPWPGENAVTPLHAQTKGQNGNQQHAV